MTRALAIVGLIATAIAALLVALVLAMLLED